MDSGFGLPVSKATKSISNKMDGSETVLDSDGVADAKLHMDPEKGTYVELRITDLGFRTTVSFAGFSSDSKQFTVFADILSPWQLEDEKESHDLKELKEVEHEVRTAIVTCVPEASKSKVIYVSSVLGVSDTAPDGYASALQLVLDHLCDAKRSAADRNGILSKSDIVVHGLNYSKYRELIEDSADLGKRETKSLKYQLGFINFKELEGGKSMMRTVGNSFPLCLIWRQNNKQNWYASVNLFKTASDLSKTASALSRVNLEIGSMGGRGGRTPYAYIYGYLKDNSEPQFKVHLTFFSLSTKNFKETVSTSVYDKVRKKISMSAPQARQIIYVSLIEGKPAVAPDVIPKVLKRVLRLLCATKMPQIEPRKTRETRNIISECDFVVHFLRYQQFRSESRVSNTQQKPDALTSYKKNLAELKFTALGDNYPNYMTRTVGDCIPSPSPKGCSLS